MSAIHFDILTPAIGVAGRITAIASGKGGVGKTWFAITFAQALARGGRRVLLFDGDLGLANVDVQLGLNPQHDLGAVLSGRVGIEQAVHPAGPVGVRRAGGAGWRVAGCGAGPAAWRGLAMGRGGGGSRRGA